MDNGRVKILNKFQKTLTHLQHNHNIVIHLFHLLKSNIHITLALQYELFAWEKNNNNNNTLDKMVKFFCISSHNSLYDKFCTTSLYKKEEKKK